MAELVFEIWKSLDDGDQMMMRVDPHNDKVRREAMPDAVCVHRFAARSGFDAFRQNNAWNGWGSWKEPDMEDPVFTEEDAAAQRGYLDEREAVEIKNEHTRPSTS